MKGIFRTSTFAVLTLCCALEAHSELAKQQRSLPSGGANGLPPRQRLEEQWSKPGRCGDQKTYFNRMKSGESGVGEIFRKVVQADMILVGEQHAPEEELPLYKRLFREVLTRRPKSPCYFVELEEQHQTYLENCNRYHEVAVSMASQNQTWLQCPGLRPLDVQQPSFPSIKAALSSGFRVFAVDRSKAVDAHCMQDPSDVACRNDHMAKRISEYRKSHQCDVSIVNVGAGHLDPEESNGRTLQSILRRTDKNVRLSTVAFRNRHFACQYFTKSCVPEWFSRPLWAQTVDKSFFTRENRWGVPLLNDYIGSTDAIIWYQLREDPHPNGRR